MLSIWKPHIMNNKTQIEWKTFKKMNFTKCWLSGWDCKSKGSEKFEIQIVWNSTRGLSQVRDPRTEKGWILYEKASMGNANGKQHKQWKKKQISIWSRKQREAWWRGRSSFLPLTIIMMKVNQKMSLCHNFFRCCRGREITSKETTKVIKYTSRMLAWLLYSIL